MPVRAAVGHVVSFLLDTFDFPTILYNILSRAFACSKPTIFLTLEATYPTAEAEKGSSVRKRKGQY